MIFSMMTLVAMFGFLEKLAVKWKLTLNLVENHFLNSQGGAATVCG